MKKSRKKMLLSSIAMLLVALVALGAATFAWYANVQTVTAETTQFSASASSGIAIRHHKNGFTGATANDVLWKTALNSANGNPLLAAPESGLSPASITYADISNNAVRGGYAVAADPSASTRGNNAISGIANALTDAHFLVDEMYVATEGTTEQNVTFSLTANGAAISDKSYLVLAIYVDGEFKKAFTSHTGLDTTSKITYTAASDPDPEVYGEAEGQALTPFTAGQQQNVGTISAKTKAADGAHIQIIAFANGFDGNCATNTVDISQLQVEYSFTIAS